jgi:hypothetical protein
MAQPEVEDLELVIVRRLLSGDGPPCKKISAYCKRLARALAPSYRNYTRTAILKECRTQLNDLFEKNKDAHTALLRKRRIEYMLRGPVIDQRTKEWLAFRASIPVTGTNCSDVHRSEAGYYAALMKKLHPEARSDNLNDAFAACRHGIIFEDIASTLYAHWNKVELIALPCIRHRKYGDIMGASPDGVVRVAGPFMELTASHGRLIEIKCPASRIPKEGFVLADYFDQMQLQMACTGIHECDFIEFVFDTDAITTGKEFVDTVVDGASVLAKGYYVLTGDYSKRIDFKILHEGDAASLDEVDALLMKEGCWVTFWVLRKYVRQLIRYDPKWLEARLPSFKRFAEDYKTHIAAGTDPEMPAAVAARQAKKKYEPKIVLDLATMA